MTKTDKATPRPWEFEQNSIELKHHGFKIYGDIGHSAQYGKSCMPIAYTFHDGELAKANAELIVRAVNNFDALLETCRKAQKELKAKGLFSVDLEQAIAQAEKEG